MRGPLRLLARAWWPVFVVGSAAACSGGDPAGGSTGVGAGVAALPPLPPPPDLAAECVLPTPDATWEKARAQIGGTAAFLPKSSGGLVAVALHFPLAVAEAIDGRVPAVCAATLTRDGSDGRGVLGVHLRWPDRLIDGLTRGSEARFDARTDAATQITVLEARDPKDAIGASGVLGNYLLIAARAEDLAAVGPYVARTMPDRAKDFPTAGVRIAGAPEAPAVDLLVRVPARAAGSPLSAVGKRATSMLQARAGALLADSLLFSPNDALEAYATALSVLDDLEGAELRVTLEGKTAHVEATASLRKDGSGEKIVRGLAAGDSAPLLALPKDTLAAVLLRQAPAAAGAGAASQASAVAQALGLGEGKDAAKIEAVAKAFGEARGEWLTAGFAFDGTGPSAYVRTAVKDAGALDGALKDFLALADGATPKDPLRGQKLRLSTGKTVLENIAGDVYRVRLARGGDGAKKAAEPPASPSATPAAVDVLFRRSDDVFVAATGYASRDALRAVLTAPTGERVQLVSEIAGPLGALGSDVSLALFLDPGRISASRAGKPGSILPAPVVLGLGRRLGDTVTVFATLDAPSTALSELTRWLAP